MAGAILWCAGILAVLLLVAYILREYEFRSSFERRLYDLRPDDLQDDAYVDALSDIIDHSEVRSACRSYVLLSLLILVTFTGFISCSDFVRGLIREIFPPLLFNILDKARAGSHFRSFFFHLLFFAICFHALPIISVIMSAKPRIDNRSPSSINERILRVVAVLFAFQQYFLDRTVSRLLRDDPNAREEQPERLHVGSIRGVVKSRLAAVIAEEVNEDHISSEFTALMEKTSALQVGSASAQATGKQYKPPSLHFMINTLIEAYGIPKARSRLKWRTGRGGKIRKVVDYSIICEIEGVAVERAWLQNIGSMAGLTKTWNSTLIRIPRPSKAVREAAVVHAKLLLLRIGDRRLNHPLPFRIARLNDGIGDDSLYIGAVVSNDNVSRFTKSMKALKAEQ